MSSNARTIADVAPTLGRKNLLINGAMEIAQRGTSFSTQAYTLDRYFYNSSGGTATVNQIELAADELAGARYALELDCTVGNDFVSIQERIEALVETAGKICTVSFDYKLTGKDLNVRVGQFVTDNTRIGTVADDRSKSLPQSADWTKFEFTFDLQPLPNGYVFAATQFVMLAIEQGAGDTSTTPFNLKVTNIQFEIGDTATDFEYRPIAEELALCQRYYEKGQSLLFRKSLSSATNDYNIVYYKVEKRVAPAIGIYDLAGNPSKVSAYISDAAVSQDNIAASFLGSSRIDGFTGGKSVSPTSWGVRFSYTADAEL